MPNNILITPGSASIQFSGSAASTIRLQVENSGSIAFYGNSGSLFGITDQLSGSLMSVNDISGLPILEVFSDDRVVMGSFNKNTLVVTGSRVGIDKAVPTADLDISGSVFITGSLRISSGGITGSLFGTSSVATSASFATTASFALSASYAPSAPGGGITSLVAGDGLTGGTITSTGTITVDTGSAHFLDGVKKELNTEGVISSSIQINTGSFSGSFTGELIGTASYAISSSYVLNAISSSFATTASAADSITFIPPTASFATNAVSASYFTGSVTFPSGLIVTGSILATTVSASLFLGTASFATSASFAPDTTFPYTGNARITGSLAITGSVTALSASISASGPQAGLYLFSSSTQANLTIVPEFGQIRYYSNGSHTFRVGNVDALSISAFSIGPSSDNQATLASTGVKWKTGYINNIFSSGSIVNTGSLIIRSGSITFENGGITGSLFGTSSWANNAISASYAPSAPGGGITSLTAGDGLTGGTITSTGTITVDTGSAHFLDGVKKELNTEGVVSSSIQINTGSFTGSFTGTLIGTSSWASDVTSASFATTSSAATSITFVPSTSSFATTASYARSAVVFPYTGSAIISGSLLVSGSTVNSGSVLVNGNLTLVGPIEPTLTYTQGANSAFVRLSSAEFRLGSVSNQLVSFAQNGTVAWYIDTTKHLLPNATNVYDIGLTGQRVRTIWTTTISSSNPIASASYALSASYAPSAPGGAGTVTQVNTGDGLSGGPITGTGTITLNTGSVHFLDGVKKELNTEGVISSSLQFNTVTTPFTGSVTGSFRGSLEHFSPSILKLTVGTTAPASPSVNDLWVDTN